RGRRRLVHHRPLRNLHCAAQERRATREIRLLGAAKWRIADREPKIGAARRTGQRDCHSPFTTYRPFMMRALPVLLLALIVAGATPVRAADLLEIYRAAQSADAVYAGARATWAAGQEKLPQGRSGLLPSVSLTGSTQRNDRSLQ